MLVTPLHCTARRFHQLKNVQNIRSLASQPKQNEEGEKGISQRFNSVKNDIQEKSLGVFNTLREKIQPKNEAQTTEKIIRIEVEDTELQPVDEVSTEISYVDPITTSLAIREDDGRSIPLLILPHTVKKAYQLNIHTNRTPRVLEKYSWLTKTLVTPGLPRQYSGEGSDIVENYDELLQEFHDVLRHTVSCAKVPRNKSSSHDVHDRLDFNILWDILRLTTKHGPDAEHLRSENSFVFHKPLVESTWLRNEGYDSEYGSRELDGPTPFAKFFMTKFQPQFVLRTKKGLGMIEDQSGAMVDNWTGDVDIPLPVDTFSLNTYRQDQVHLGVRPGIDHFIQSPHQHTHTTLLHNNKLRTPQQLCASALLASFSQLSSQARASGCYQGTELTNPLVTQSIITDGHRMMFLVYQLNTLCTQDDAGIWNRAWYSGPLEMFKRREKPKHRNGFLVFEDGESCENELKGFNEDCFRLLVQFMRKSTV